MKRILLSILMLCVLGVQAQTYVSPSGRVTVERLNNGMFRILCGDKHVVEVSTVGVTTSSQTGTWKPTDIVKQDRFKTDYRMVAGKTSHASNTANRYTFCYDNGTGCEPVRMVWLVFDDGVAFRYEMDGLSSELIQDENTAYHIPEGIRRWVMEWDMGYERFFPLTISGDMHPHHWCYPMLIEPHDGLFALITEANIESPQSASSLKNNENPELYKVCPDQNDVRQTGNWHSPWRVVITGSLADVVESTLVTDVSEPCLVKDTRWIQPGIVSWVYWAYNTGSKDFQIVKKYIDLAATLHLRYVLIDWQWDQMSNGGNIDDALAYAKEKGVRTLLWYNSSTAWVTEANGPLYRLNKSEDREREFQMLEEKGVAGVKIDFFAGDTQPTMEYCIDLLESAARHHLLVDFHGATIPRGWQRTWPNLMSVEAVYGAEWYNNNGRLTHRAAAHNCTLPFTRNVIGPMDYTPCAFSDSQHPHITTHAHELALTVVFESALQHLADRPESLLAQPDAVKDFFSGLPAAWDETRLLGGYPAQYVVLARRSGKTWYVGILNGNDTSRTVVIPWTKLDKMPKGRIQMFEDSGDKSSPWLITTPKHLPTSLQLVPRGGAVVRIGK
ncbi:MAG: glycoside hydrolase family 97 protein [Bacteroidaceae bacterium]|nr:glycoside hydrolase family 97 protein [Bacteroidaceae bacterium]